MRKLIIIVFSTALMMSMVTYAHSKTLKLDPTSALAQQAVTVALAELEARGLAKEQFTAEVYKRDSSVYVIFRDRALLSEEDEEDEEDDDSTPAEILEVTLSGDARHVVESHFAR